MSNNLDSDSDAEQAQWGSAGLLGEGRLGAWSSANTRIPNEEGLRRSSRRGAAEGVQKRQEAAEKTAKVDAELKKIKELPPVNKPLPAEPKRVELTMADMPPWVRDGYKPVENYSIGNFPVEEFTTADLDVTILSNQNRIMEWYKQAKKSDQHWRSIYALELLGPHYFSKQIELGLQVGLLENGISNVIEDVRKAILVLKNWGNKPKDASWVAAQNSINQITVFPGRVRRLVAEVNAYMKTLSGKYQGLKAAEQHLQASTAPRTSKLISYLLKNRPAGRFNTYVREVIVPYLIKHHESPEILTKKIMVDTGLSRKYGTNPRLIKVITAVYEEEMANARRSFQRSPATERKGLTNQEWEKIRMHFMTMNDANQLFQAYAAEVKVLRRQLTPAALEEAKKTLSVFHRQRTEQLRRKSIGTEESLKHDYRKVHEALNELQKATVLNRKTRDEIEDLIVEEARLFKHREKASHYQRDRFEVDLVKQSKQYVKEFDAYETKISVLQRAGSTDKLFGWILLNSLDDKGKLRTNLSINKGLNVRSDVPELDRWKDASVRNFNVFKKIHTIYEASTEQLTSPKAKGYINELLAIKRNVRGVSQRLIDRKVAYLNKIIAFNKKKAQGKKARLSKPGPFITVKALRKLKKQYKEKPAPKKVLKPKQAPPPSWKGSQLPATPPKAKRPSMSSSPATPPSMPATPPSMPATPPHMGPPANFSSPSGFSRAIQSSVIPAVGLPPPPPPMVRYLKGLLPHLYSVPALKPIQEGSFSKQFKKDHREALEEFQPHLKAGKHARRERIGSFIEVVVYPHRFEFVVYPGVDQASIHEMISKIQIHLRSIDPDVKISLFTQGKGAKQKLIAGSKVLRSGINALTRLINRQMPKSNKPKHLVLEMINAVGGALSSLSIHDPLLRRFFML